MEIKSVFGNTNMVGTTHDGKRQFALICFAAKTSALKAREAFRNQFHQQFKSVRIIDTEA